MNLRDLKPNTNTYTPTFNCEYNGCSKGYNRLKSYKEHLRLKHNHYYNHVSKKKAKNKAREREYNREYYKKMKVNYIKMCESSRELEKSNRERELVERQLQIRQIEEEEQREKVEVEVRRIALKLNTRGKHLTEEEWDFYLKNELDTE